jgi:hypothetical protein
MLLQRFITSALYRSGVYTRLRQDLRNELGTKSAELREGRGEAKELAKIGRTLSEMNDGQRRLTDLLHTLQQQQEALTEQVQNTSVLTRKLELAMMLNEKHRDALAQFAAHADLSRIRSHVAAAFDRVPVEDDPLPHVYVENLLPADFYALMLDAIPPPVFFGERDPIKQNLRPAHDNLVPTLTSLVLRFWDERVIPDVLTPALLAKFGDRRRDHYEELFGADLAAEAAALPQLPSSGRLMLRRPGYHLAPHLDPKRVFVTGLLYLARPGDSEIHGTQLFRIDGAVQATYASTFYPEREGLTCTATKTAPFRPNALLAFMNAKGAHGAHIPKDAPSGLVRHSYQFYIGPPPDALEALVERLPADRRQHWKRNDDRQ